VEASSSTYARADASAKWTGWVGFAGWLMIMIGAIDVFEGLIAVIRDKYYVLAPNQIIIFDMTTWGWLTLLWGILLCFAGWGLITRASWARWFSIVALSVNVLGQLAWLGSAQYPLWTLTVITFTIIVVYVLIVHWGEVEAAY
jgi:hypothetical protein